MSGAGVTELIWLLLAVLVGLGVVIAWIIKSEAGRNFLKAEIKRLKFALEAAEREKDMMVEEMQAFTGGTGAPSGAQSSDNMLHDNIAIGKMVEKIEGLEKDNAKLKKELDEARSSLEEVYKALCSK